MNSETRAFIAAHPDLSDADMAAALAADITTARNILTDDLSGFLTRLPGLFQAFLGFKSGQLPPELGVLKGPLATLDYILTNLRGRVQGGQLVGGFIKTTDPGVAAQMQQLLGGFQQAGLLTADDATAFLALGGGYRYDRLTEAEVATARQRFAGEQAALDLRNRLADATRAVELQITAYEQSIDADPATAAPTWDALAATFAATE